MANLITDRIAYFLKEHAPFSFISHQELQVIVSAFKVKYYQKGALFFEEGKANTGFAYVLRKGNVLLRQLCAGANQLVDQCEPGDVFGVRSILSGNHYVMSAEAVEESLVYLIPVKVFNELLLKHQRFALFFASGYAAGQALAGTRTSNSGLSLVLPVENELIFSKNVLVCSERNSIREAAQKMASHNVGSIIVMNSEGKPAGIVTDRDLRVKVVAEGTDLSQQVRAVMTSPVISLPDHATVTEVQMTMIDAGIHHLILTNDGVLSGIVSDHDILLSNLNHPEALLKSLKYSEQPVEWKALRQKAEEMLKLFIDQDVSIELLARLISKINDLIIQKALDLHLERLELDPVDFAWISLGSEGREEQLLRTDQDNAIIFDDLNSDANTQSRLLELAERVNATLEYCGFAKCPAEIMARNPKWCQPLSAWKKYFHEWIVTPDTESMLHCTIFFDFRLIFGSPKLVADLYAYEMDLIRKNGNFLSHLAKNAVKNPPPLSFFKNLMVERSGEHADQFDIKGRAMMPLADIARVLALQHGLDQKNTIARFKALVDREPNYQSLLKEAQQAYGLLMKYRVREGLAKASSGRFIEISELNKLEKQILKNAFQPIKELQDMLEVRFKLAYFS